MKKKLILIFSVIFMFSSIVSAVQVCETYDDFSSGVLDASKWEIRQDTEGQPLMDEYGVLLEEGNYVFHTGQNTGGDKRVYLVPKYKFGVGDRLEYDVSINSGANVNLLIGGSCSRCAFGVISSSIGSHHVAVIFNQNQISVEVDANFLGDAPIGSTERVHDLYVGAMFGNHVDFDNFIICSEQEEPPVEDNFEERISELENKIIELEERIEELEAENDELKERTSLLEELVDKIIEWIENLPKGLSNSWS